jgi:hypothetical protein
MTIYQWESLLAGYTQEFVAIPRKMLNGQAFRDLSGVEIEILRAGLNRYSYKKKEEGDKNYLFRPEKKQFFLTRNE